MNFHIREGSLSEVLLLSGKIPEFDFCYIQEEYERRFRHSRPIILVAYDGPVPIGFKVGYDRYSGSGFFYSLLGAVNPIYRRNGIATLLADKQESLLRAQNYIGVRLKTRKKFEAMTRFTEKRGFRISADKNLRDDEILMEKRFT